MQLLPAIAMPRRALVGSAGLAFHVMNRAARRSHIFQSFADYEAFERLLSEAQRVVPLRLLAYVVMPTHWHLVVWPQADTDLSRHMQWLTRTHAQHWHRAHGSVGTGALYQGRYRAIPIQDDGHLLTACLYVERNPLRAGLVERAGLWRWSSAAISDSPTRPALAEWPVPRPATWHERVDHKEAAETARILRDCIRQSVPFGNDAWAKAVASRLTLRGRACATGVPR